MGVLQKLFKLWPWVDLDPFYAKVKFGDIGFCMGETENYLFFGNYCSLRSQSCLKHLAKWVNEVKWVSKVNVILWPWSKVTQISTFKLVFLKNSRAIWTKVHMKAWGGIGMKIYTNELGHMANMATMPIYGKNLKKSSSPVPIDRWPWNIVCSIVYARPTKIVQIMTLVWPWPILRQGQIWSHRLLYGKKWKLLFFGNYCSPWYQSCLKHSTKWVNEVEWVSKVKAILWPWSKVTQILKLKLVFCRNSWAI